MNWDEIARQMLEAEEQTRALQSPPGEGVLVEWRGEVYIGEVQGVASEYSNEIVFLGKSSKPIDDKLQEAILRLQPDRTQISAESIINLEGRLHVLRRTSAGLVRMTSDQVNYMRQKPLVIGDANSGDFAFEQEVNLYRDKDKEL